MHAHPTMPLETLLRDTAQQLTPVAGANAFLEARLLAMHAWGTTPEQLVRDRHLPVEPAGYEQLQAFAARRLNHEPISHILGHKHFWKDTFLVTPEVLTPRADSETLIEAMLRLRPQRGAAYALLDLGTGSGCLILSALREYGAARGTAVDLSPAALAVARSNAETLGLSARLRLLHGVWTAPLDSADRFDIVMTNPPYIAHAAMAALDEDVKGYEPHLALDGGIDGLDCYRAIFASLGSTLNPGALVLAEVGAGQAADVAAIGETNGLRHVETTHDLAGIPRIVCFTNQR